MASMDFKGSNVFSTYRYFRHSRLDKGGRDFKRAENVGKVQTQDGWGGCLCNLYESYTDLKNLAIVRSFIETTACT